MHADRRNGARRRAGVRGRRADQAAEQFQVAAQVEGVGVGREHDMAQLAGLPRAVRAAVIRLRW